MTVQNKTIISKQPIIASEEGAKQSAQLKTQPLIPKLRFKEFDGEWEKIEFGKIAEFKNGLNFSKEQEGIGLKVIGVGDFKNHMSLSYEGLSKVNVPEKQKEAYLLKENDIIFVRSNGNKELIGRALFLNNVKEELGYSGFTIRARFNSFKDIHPYFYAIYFKSAAPKQQFLLLGGGTNISNLNQQILSGLRMPKPSLPEQQKIAAFLSAVDQKIQQLTQKKALLLDYKKGVMQQLFSQQLRFKPVQSGVEGDDDGNDYPDWEDMILGDCLKYVQPTKFLVSSTEYDNSFETPVLTAGKTFVLGYTDEKENICTDYPLIIFDDFTTASKYVDFPFKAKSSAMKLLLAREGVDIKFMFEAMQNIKFEVGGHGRHWISIFSQLIISVPSFPEQKKIASFLSSIDTKIEQVNQQLNQTQIFKKGLLQQMFV